MNAARTSGNSFQLRYIDCIGVIRAGCHTGNLPCSSTAITNRYRCMRRFPCGRCICRSRIGRRIVTGSSLINRGNGIRTERYAAVFFRIGFRAEYNRLAGGCSNTAGRRTHHNRIFCIGNRAVRTDDSYTAYIGTCISITVQ